MMRSHGALCAVRIRCCLGLALLLQQQFDGAIDEYREVIRLKVITLMLTTILAWR